MNTAHRLVVIGNGMAGARLVEDLLARGAGDRFRITIFGDEPFGNYNRILLSGVLAGTQQPEDIFINPLEWYREQGVTLHAGSPVVRICRDIREVRTAKGHVERYDTLVLATGSVPFVPPLEGLHAPLSTDAAGMAAYKPGVFVFRTLEDCERLLARAAAVRRAAVIGGGLLGLEAARGLVARGLTVDVVHLMDHLMEVQLDRNAGLMLQRSMDRLGVRTHLGRQTIAILGDREVEGLRFSDGTTLETDLVVIAAGIRPNVALARDAGLAVNRGVIVGDDMVSVSDPAICAVGECAEHRGVAYGLVAPLWEQTAVLADRLSGARPDAAYTGSRTSTRLKVMGIDLAVMGEKDAQDPDDEVVTYSEPRRGVYQKLVVRDGRLAGAILLGDTSAFPTLQQLFDRGEPLPDARTEVLFPGRDAGASRSVADLPDAAQVCNCNGVSKGAIAAAVRGGCRTLKAVCDRTRAATGCGSCRGQVEEIVRAVAGDGLEDDPSIHYYVPGVPLTKPELVKAIRERNLRSVSAVFDALADGREDPASKPGLASLLRTIWHDEDLDERDARFINDRVHANIQKDRTFSVVPRIYGGVTSPAELRRIADVAEKYNVPMVKITGGQRIDLLGIRREQLPDVWRDLGMPSGHAYTKAFRTCKTCVGSEFCRFGLGDSTALGIAIERRYQGLESPAKMKLAVAGCPRNCSEATTKDVGVVAIEGGRWEIYVGGAAGSRVRKGDLLATVDSHDEVIRLAGRFMQWYRENARYLERTYDFVERIGIDRVRRVVVDDEERIAARLDEEVQRAVDAYVDPWLEAERPVHPAQFASVLTPVGGRR
ncbi:MAG TPA: nitrite reductase large subunit NirB [Vicinamibacterales bacterium]